MLTFILLAIVIAVLYRQWKLRYERDEYSVLFNQSLNESFDEPHEYVELPELRY